MTARLDDQAVQRSETLLDIQEMRTADRAAIAELRDRVAALEARVGDAGE